MKRIYIIALLLSSGFAALTSCDTGKYRKPKDIYMPDMYYSRAYDAYTENPIFADDQTSRLPVSGTIKRGEMLPYHMPDNDSGYAYSGTIHNPLVMDDSMMQEGQRLFNIYCAVCHGEKLNGNGPLYKDGSGPYPAKPANFMAANDRLYWPEGTEFYVATYGIRLMGSYASQLNQHQRWMVVGYIKAMQRKNGSTQAKEDSVMHAMESTYLKTKAEILAAAKK
jgi:hypothetical protein